MAGEGTSMKAPELFDLTGRVALVVLWFAPELATTLPRMLYGSP